MFWLKKENEFNFSNIVRFSTHIETLVTRNSIYERNRYLLTPYIYNGGESQHERLLSPKVIL